MRLESLDMIWVEKIAEKKRKSGIVLLEEQSERLTGDFFEAQVVKIGIAIPKERLESPDGSKKLEEGDIVIMQKWSQATEEMRSVGFEGRKYLLISTHDIMGFDKKK